MSTTFPVAVYLSIFAMHVPMILVCIAAVAVIIARWRQAPNASLWALAGFGLALAMSIAAPLVQVLLQAWLTRAGTGEYSSRAWAFSAFGVVISILNAVVYALLLAAIYAGRPRSGAPNAGAASQ